jgi:mRNA interferase MazF
MIKIEPDNLNHISKTSAIDCFQIRSVSEKRFVTIIGTINEKTANEIKCALSKVLSIKLD